jgi:anti-sigma factor RsiW
MTEEEDRVEYAEQNNLLKRRFDAVLTEPIPARMYLKRPAWLDYARAAVLVAVGVAIGIALPYVRPEPARPTASTLPIRAAHAHQIYTPEVRHPVEVEAKEQDHLVKWLSKRLRLPLKIPVLATEGFELVGGRLLPGPDGPVAYFMFQDATGKRLTLYVSRRSRAENLTAFRFAQDGNISVFYWIDRECGYAISGEIDKPALARVAASIYRQLEP